MVSASIASSCSGQRSLFILVYLSSSSRQADFPSLFLEIILPCQDDLICLASILEPKPYLGGLTEQGMAGPRPMCFLQNCGGDQPPHVHMFFTCHVTIQIWHDLASLLDFPHNIFNSIQQGFDWWSSQSAPRRSLFLIACWHIWIWRNDTIFSSFRKPTASILLGVTSLMDVLGI